MLISGESSRMPASLFAQAEQLARDADRITKDLLDKEISLRDTQCKIAVLIKEYVKLCKEIGRQG